MDETTLSWNIAVATSLFVSPVMAGTPQLTGHKHKQKFEPYKMVLTLKNETGSDLEVKGCTVWNADSDPAHPGCVMRTGNTIKNGETLKEVATVTSHWGPADVFLNFSNKTYANSKDLDITAFVTEKQKDFRLFPGTIGYQFKEKNDMDGCNPVEGEAGHKGLKAVTYYCTKTLVKHKIN